MKLIARSLCTAVSALMEIANELKSIRQILENTAYPDMAVTAKQAAVILGCSEAKINNMYRKGEIHRSIIGGKRGFSVKELRAL